MVIWSRENCRGDLSRKLSSMVIIPWRILVERSARLLILALAFGAFFASASPGQDQKQRYFFVGGGMSFPLYPQNFSDNWKLGYGIGGGLMTSLSPILQLGIEAEYNNFALDHDRFSFYDTSGQRYRSTGGSAGIFFVSPVLKLMFSRARDGPSAFALLRIGFHHESTSDLTISGSSNTYTLSGTSHSALSMGVGIGLDIPINEGIGIILRAEFVNAFTDVQSTQYLPLRGGFRFSL